MIATIPLFVAPTIPHSTDKARVRMTTDMFVRVGNRPPIDYDDDFRQEMLDLFPHEPGLLELMETGSNSVNHILMQALRRCRSLPTLEELSKAMESVQIISISQFRGGVQRVTAALNNIESVIKMQYDLRRNEQRIWALSERYLELEAKQLEDAKY